MYSHFEWPIPPHYALPPGEEFVGHEPAVVTLARGQKVAGSLTRFLPTHGMVEFLPSRGRVNLDIPLVDIVHLRLTRALVLKARPALLEKHGAVSPPSERQPFRVELANGEVVSGETAGFEVHGAGLFLYPATYGDAVLRSFIPAAAIKSQQIGRPLGEILVAGKLASDTQVRNGLARQKELREQKLGDILTEQKIISGEQLRVALERQRGMPMVRLGEALVAAKMITPAQLAQALQRQSENRKRPLGQILVDLEYVSKRDLFQALSQKLGVPAVDLKNFRLDPEALKLLPESVIHEFKVMPLGFDGQAVVLATENPLDPAPLERIRFLTQRAVTPVIASAEDIAECIQAQFGAKPSADARIEDLATRLTAETALLDGEDPIKESDSTLVRLVNKMILDAHSGGASDIHIEANPGRKNVRVRFRRDGVLADYLQLPTGFGGAIVSRLKIMASLDISEKRRAQDGRINFQKFGPANVELRMVTVPTLEGLEDVVLRLLAAGEPMPIDRLGLRDPLRDGLKDLLGKSFGLILVCGPTGSGKTTTLHSLLGVLNSPERKIWTAEDPVEISQPGLRQVQVNTRIGWTFAAAMRSFLRADPDVIMVGEMRDAETAAIGIEASLTGHLVFSTLHTNSAPETVVRLLEMGMDPFSFADSLAGVLAQRLVRRLCPDCRGSRALEANEAAALAVEYCRDTPLDAQQVRSAWNASCGEPMLHFSARGCEACKQTGYRGRIGVHELLVITPDLRQRIQRRAAASELRSAAIGAGMRTLRQDGIEKCLLGLTDLQEVRATTS